MAHSLKHGIRLLRTPALCAGIIAAGVFFMYPGAALEVLRDSRSLFRHESVLFTGDVMLARRVESIMDAEGGGYVFSGLRELFAEHDAVVVNFEAAVPERHIPTPEMTMRFSVDVALLPALAREGVTHATLANNHALDFGEDGYAHTVDALDAVDIAAFGHPQHVRTADIDYITIDDVRIALIPVNATWGIPAGDGIGAVISEAATASDAQFVLVHWGTEYASTAGEAQRTFAETLIDAGADAIIGHHPHVVQNISQYRGAPIFYSLGNCIFDQYWNKDVREGLTVSVSVDGNELVYGLVPVSSVAKRSVPEVMVPSVRSQFLDALARRSDAELAADIREGELRAPYALAPVE